MTILEELESVLALCNRFTWENVKGTTISDVELDCVAFIRKSYAEIRSNALRLKAIEAAIQEMLSDEVGDPHLINQQLHSRARELVDQWETSHDHA